jgi:hypothetical protein
MRLEWLAFEIRTQEENMALSIGSFLIVFLEPDNLLAIALKKDVGIILFLFIVLVLVFFVWPKPELGGPAMFFSTFWGLSIAVLLLTLIFFAPEIDKPMAVLDAISGAVFGWFLGIYLSPHSKEEREAFTGYKSALVGLLSGVVLTKAQTLLSERFTTARDIHLKDAEYFLIFWVAVGVCAVAVYNARAYGEVNKPQPNNNQAAVPGQATVSATGSALETENAKLKRLVAELSLEKQTLKDVAEGNL